jgi:ribosomal-protein-alanine N-acetyltransferase
LNFAVSASLRHRSIGTQMIEKLVGKLSSQRRTEITLEVRETNLDAQIFFRQGGFRATDVLRDFYDDSTEDAYVMQYYYKTDDSEMILPINRIDRRRAG